MKSFIKRSACIVCVAALMLSAGLLASADTRGWYIKHRSGERPLFPGDADELSRYGCYYIDDRCNAENKKIYLTFDAGYENGNVEKILDVMKKYNVPGAFFVLDNIILKNTDLVIRMVDDGHLVCNHTKRHHDLSRASADEIARDLGALEDVYRENTGRELSRYFRFPEGKYSIEAVKAVNGLGYKTVFWSFAYPDWDNSNQLSPERAVRKIIDNTHNGAVMLFHPTSSTNAQIFEQLIIEWQNMGYTFGTLDELVN